MRDYLSVSNLCKALCVGAVTALMSVPRIIQTGVDLWIYLPVAWGAMTLCAAAATAWSARGGMCGLFPHRRRMLAGAGIAVILTCAITPIYSFLLDPIFRQTIASAGGEKMLMLRYPVTLSGCFAVTLWSAGFETIFFRAAAISFFVRLTDRQWIAVAAAVALRMFVFSKQLSEAGIVDAMPLFVICTLITSIISCALFVRTGLPGAMVFSAGLNIHLFIR